jgi:hypothetical protein
LPVVKVTEDKYLIGTQIRTIIFVNDKLVLNVGGGFMELSVWMQKNCVIQAIKFAKTISETPEMDSRIAIHKLLE